MKPSVDGVVVIASDSGLLLTEDPGSIPRSCRLPNKLSLQWKGSPVVKSTATTDLRLARGGLRRPVSPVAGDSLPSPFRGTPRSWYVLHCTVASLVLLPLPLSLPSLTSVLVPQSRASPGSLRRRQNLSRDTLSRHLSLGRLSRPPIKKKMSNLNSA